MSNNSAAQRNRKIRQDALREQLAQQCHEQHVIEIINELSDSDLEFDSLMIRRKEVALNAHLKLMAKYIPDLKSQELTGADGGDLVIAVQRKRFDGDD
jgi:hypothetical protein